MFTKVVVSSCEVGEVTPYIFSMAKASTSITMGINPAAFTNSVNSFTLSFFAATSTIDISSCSSAFYDGGNT